MRNSRSETLFRGFIHQPRSTWARRVFFQIHLWTGVALALYLAAIGITGSILVFGEELEPMGEHDGASLSRPALTMAQAAAVAARTAPGKRITLAFPPSPANPGYTFVIPGHSNVYVDAATGRSAAPPARRTWLNVVSAIHVNLLVGERGRTVNGIGATGLLLLAITGLVLWWPGIASLSRSFRIDLRRGWKRIVWDLHAITGLFGSVMIAMWSLTAVSFLWPEVTRSALGWVSPISQPTIPRLSAESRSDPPIETILAHVDAAQAPGRLRWVLLPTEKDQPLMLMVSRELGDHALHYDRIYLDPSTGSQIGSWRWDDGKSFSDWILRLCLPIHTGMHWGLFIKVIWAILGLLLPMLGITGLVMYWNRFLRWKWRSISQ